MADHDLFGLMNLPAMTTAERKRMRRKAASMPKGYAAMPGTGPEGERCNTCKHLTRRRFAKTYLKCELMRAIWTGGSATDIRAGSPACKRWEAPT